MRRWRCISFDDWQAKARYLDGAAWVDARLLPRVRSMAHTLARPHGASSPEKMEAICRDVFRFARDRIRYISDPAGEEFSDAQQTLEASEGDCDDKVRCFIALCRVLRIEAHVRPVMRSLAFAHVQAVVRFQGSERYPRADADGWIPAELILRDARLGDEVQDVPSLANA